MTQLANANLLDDDLANGSSLKNKRLNKVAQRAKNPVPKKMVAVEEKLEDEDEYEDEKAQPKKSTISKPVEEVELEYDEPKEYSTRKSFYADQQRYLDEDIKSNRNNKVNDEKKILGMNPALFYGLLAVGVAVGGYFVYKKFFKKGKTDLKSVTNPVNPIAVTPNPPTPVASSGGEISEIIK